MRTSVLGSAPMAVCRVPIVLTPLADADSLRRAPSDLFKGLERASGPTGFAVTDLGSGWAVNAFDALMVIAAAGDAVAVASDPLTRGHLATALSRFRYEPVALASGTLRFDAYGNRAGDPAVVRLCPIRESTGVTGTRTTTPPPPGPCP
jgi:ABC-type branched-subunit amino acid transport system substrate-binding protein